MKKLMLQQDKLPDTVEKLQLSSLEEKMMKFALTFMPDTINKIFEFLKEKQQLLLIADTKDKLEQLKNGVIPTETPPTADAAQAAWSSDVSSQDTTSQNTSVQTIHADHQKNNPWHTKQHLISEHSTTAKYGVMSWGVVAEVWQSVMRNGMKIWGNVLVEWSHLKKAEKLAEAMNESGVRKWFDDVVEVLKARKASGKLLDKQIKAIDKTIRNIEAAAQSTEGLNDLAVWKKLVKEWKLSANLFGKMKPEAIARMAKQMSAFATDTVVIENLRKLAEVGDKAGIKALLQSKGMSEISDDLVESLMHTKGSQELLESTISIFAKWDKITKLAHAARALPLLDLVFYGVEVWDFATNEEAEKIANEARKNNEEKKQKWHLAIDTVWIWIPAVWATSAAIYGLYTWLAASWPAWWIVLWWVAAAEWIKYGADKLYFEVQDFYKQNKADFAQQSLTQVKQAILQSNYAGLGENLSLNDILWWVWKTESVRTLKDALWAAMFLEETQSSVWGSWKYSLVAKKMQLESIAHTLEELPPEQQEVYYAEKKALDAQAKELAAQQKTLQNMVNERMQYMTPYLAWGQKQQEFQQAITAANGMQYVDVLLAKSKAYQEMIHDKTLTDVASVDEYIALRKNTLQQKNSALYTRLVALHKNNPSEYAEVVRQILIYKRTIEKDTDYQALSSTIDLVEEFDYVFGLWVPHGVKYDLADIAHVDYVYIDQMIKNLAAWKDILTVPHSLTSEQVKTNLTSWRSEDHGEWDSKRFVEVQQYSDSIWQNVLYRMAKEFHGYSGQNTMKELQAFYRKSENSKQDNALGIYFDPEDQVWKMNNDYAKDQVLNLHDLEKKSVDQIMSDWCKEIPYWQHMLAWSVIPWGAILANAVLPKAQTKDMIDTATESVDGQLNKEFLVKLQHIITKEKQFLAPEQQKKVQDEILSYIRKWGQWWYVELPYSLIHKAARAGLWQLQYYYFSIDATGKIHAVSRHEYISRPLHIPGIVKQYLDETNPECKKPFDEIDWQKVPLISLDKNTTGWKAVEQVANLTKEIQKTAGELTREGRWGVLYDPLKKILQSRWKETKLDNKNGKWIVGDGKLAIEYTSLHEAAMVANVINWFGGKYKKEYPEMELQYGSMWWVRSWLFDVNTWFWWFDTALISWKTITKHLSQTFANEKNSNAFIEYIKNNT